MASASSPVGASRSSGRLLLGLAVVACVVRIAFVLGEPGSKLAGDEWRWIGWGIEPPGGVASPKVAFSPFRTHMIFDPPVYPYFIAALHVIFHSLVAVKVAQAVLGAVLVVAIGRLGASVFGERPGLVAAAIAAFYPELIWFSAHFWSETLFMAFLWWSMERLVAGDRDASARAVVVAGLLWGFAVLTRETVLYFLPLAAVWLAWGRGAAGRWRAALFVACALAVIAPWTYRNWVVFDAFVPVSTAGGQNLFQANARIDRNTTYEMVDAVPGRIGQYQYAMRKGLEAIRDRQPWWIFEKLREQMPNFWEADSLALIHVKRGADDPPGGYGRTSVAAAWAVAIVTLAPFVLVLAGFVLGLRTLPWNRGTQLLAGFLLYYIALHVVTHGFARYRMPALPVLFLVAAWAVAAPVTARVTSPLRRWIAVVAAVALAVSLVPSVHKNLSHPALGGAGTAGEVSSQDEPQPGP